MDTIWLVLEIASYCVYAIIIPVAIYFNVKLCSQNNEMFLQKRSLLIVYGLNISFVSGIIVLLVAQILILHTSTIIYESVALILFLMVCWVFLFFLINKNWNIYYQYWWTFYTLQSKWQSIINTSMNKNSSNWFIVNKTKYGNIQYMCTLCGVLCFFGFITCLCCVITWTIFEYNLIAVIIGFLFILLTLAPPILLYIIIVRKTPSYYDIWHIHSESKLHAKLLLLLGIVYGVTDSSFILTLFNRKVMIFGCPALSVVLFAMNYVSTRFILKQNIHLSVANESKIQSQSQSDMKPIDLYAILSNENSFHLFMVHLSREWSMEVLLFYCEVIQFQNYLRDYTDNPPKIQLVNLPPNIPMSSIIDNVDVIPNHTTNDNQMISISKIKAYKLYEKYIAVNSVYEINISAQQRQELIDVLDDLEKLLSYNITINDLYVLFEKPKLEMDMLLHLSLTRFRYQTEFNEIKSILSE